MASLLLTCERIQTPVLSGGLWVRGHQVVEIISEELDASATPDGTS
jgi:hypothetical protein